MIRYRRLNENLCKIEKPKVEFHKSSETGELIARIKDFAGWFLCFFLGEYNSHFVGMAQKDAEHSLYLLVSATSNLSAIQVSEGWYFQSELDAEKFSEQVIDQLYKLVEKEGGLTGETIKRALKSL